ncbi:MAG TPA: transglutaminase-like domain-containing protein, partial [Solirubrobacteraceae bacterium]
MGAVALPRAARAPARAVARPWRARLAAFAVLGMFAGLHWGALIDPGRGGAMLLALLCALTGAGVLVAVPAGAADWQRRAAVGVVTFVLLVLALLCAGVPLWTLAPRGWDDLVNGMVQGISTTPGITVPYRGVDEWVRTAILSGGTALLGLGAVLAFRPRRGGGLVSPLPAAMALGTLYAVPIIERGPETPYFDGAIFCILLAGLLWLERLPSDQVAVAMACVLVSAIVGAVVAPRLDGTRPWFDYESFAEKLEPTKAEAFSWNHSYGPLHWPRDGREMLLVKAKHSAYWKATNLPEFDGVRWREGRPSRAALSDARLNGAWLQTISVIDRGLRSQQFVGAGVTQEILPRSSRVALPQPDGTFVTARAALRPGDSYQALVYTPRPTERQLRRAGTDYPAYTQEFRELRIPLRGAVSARTDPITGRPLGPSALVRFPAYGQAGVPLVVWPSRFGVQEIGVEALVSSPYARLYELTQILLHGARSPYDFAQKVRERVQTGTTYDESPPPSRYPLASFLFDTRAGYCQQFSGVMALMLRMGGVPARVASGFSPGSYNSRRKQYVVRDTDAHSWVEAYFPHLGWITFDPTPAASPASAQFDDANTGAGGGASPSALATGLGQAGDRPFASGDPGAAVAPRTSNASWRLPVAAALLALGLGSLGLVLWRRRRPFVALAPELAELQTALRRSGRNPSPEVTLSRLEALLGGSEAAAAYVRAVRDRRFGRRVEGPTPTQR